MAKANRHHVKLLGEIAKQACAIQTGTLELNTTISPVSQGQVVQVSPKKISVHQIGAAKRRPAQVSVLENCATQISTIKVCAG